MSLSRALFNEFRPFFRLLEDPFFNSPTPYSSFARQGQLADPFSWQSSRPALNLSEEEDGSYVVEAELPGVKKENLDVKIGDGGRSLTIEGRVLRRGMTQPAAPGQPTTAEATTMTAPAGGQSSALTTTTGICTLSSGKDENTNIDVSDGNNQVGTANDGQWSSSRTFTRTVWLPHPVNAQAVKAKLEDGILTIRAGRQNQESVNVAVD